MNTCEQPVYLQLEGALLDTITDKCTTKCSYNAKYGMTQITNIETVEGKMLELTVEPTEKAARFAGRACLCDQIFVYAPAISYTSEDIKGEIVISHFFNDNTELRVHIPFKEGEGSDGDFLSTFACLVPFTEKEDACSSTPFDMDELIPKAAFYFGQGLPIIMKDYEDNTKYICKDYPMGREDVDLFFHPKDAKTFNKDNIDKITCTDKPHCITSTPIDVESGQDVTGRPQTTPDNNERLKALLKKGEVPNAVVGGEYLECEEIISITPSAEGVDDDLDPNSPLIQVIIGLTVVIGLGFTIKFVNDKFG